MCGIVGYIGNRQAIPILLEGLTRLEYRGYDSAGLAIIEDKHLAVEKEVGKVAVLVNKLSSNNLNGQVGIGHTRWATHGEPAVENAHPQVSHNRLALVHNGIIENYQELKEELIKNHQVFQSQTDSEVLVHLIYAQVKAGKLLKDATMAVLGRVEGTFGVLVIDSTNPGEIIVARRGSPLLLGIAKGGMIIASDATAMLGHTNSIVYLKDDELAVCQSNEYQIYGLDNQKHERGPEKVKLEQKTIEKGGYDHFLLKEIMEQPTTAANAIRGRIDKKNITSHLGGLNIDDQKWRSANRLISVGCGTASYAALLGKYQLEKILKVPVQVEYASEFRYRGPALSSGDIAMLLSQSGETADTIASLNELKRRGIATLGLVNVVGSTIAREVDGGVYLHSGPEISVASTKAFTNMVIAQLLVGLYMGRLRGLGTEEAQEIIDSLEDLPAHIAAVLEQSSKIKKIANKLCHHENALYLGRDSYYPVALEASHKLKEISYIHAEAYPTGEMKHGANALIDKNLLVVMLCPHDHVYEKSLSNLQEINARHGRVLLIANEGDNKLSNQAEHVIFVPKTNQWIGPLIMNTALQLFAYFVAVARGTDVDQPRNLAKSVTVE